EEKSAFQSRRRLGAVHDCRRKALASHGFLFLRHKEICRVVSLRAAIIGFGLQCRKPELPAAVISCRKKPAAHFCGSSQGTFAHSLGSERKARSASGRRTTICDFRQCRIPCSSKRRRLVVTHCRVAPTMCARSACVNAAAMSTPLDSSTP